MTTITRCLIVDDEPVARKIVRNYCSHLPGLTIVAECGNALEAKTHLSAGGIHLLFLDIDMPVLSGTRLLQSLPQPPLVIFTTAYQEYAVTAFDLNACDYLVKPFSLERFIIAVDKATALLKTIRPAADHFFIKTGGSLARLAYADMLYAEAQANYTKVVLVQQTLLTKMPLTDFMALLPADQFLKIHRSFIINKNAVAAVEGNRVMVSGHAVPIAANYKVDFFKAMGIG